MKPKPLRYFDPICWQDYTLVPWWLICYAFAWTWARFWHPYMALKVWWRWHGRPLLGLPQLRRPVIYGRHINPDPIICRCCLWAGPRRWAYHTYQDDGSGEDVEAIDQCPRCGGEI